MIVYLATHRNDGVLCWEKSEVNVAYIDPTSLQTYYQKQIVSETNWGLTFNYSMLLVTLYFTPSVITIITIVCHNSHNLVIALPLHIYLDVLWHNAIFYVMAGYDTYIIVSKPTNPTTRADHSILPVNSINLTIHRISHFITIVLSLKTGMNAGAVQNSLFGTYDWQAYHVRDHISGLYYTEQNYKRNM
jgi:hypothetical protein